MDDDDVTRSDGSTQIDRVRAGDVVVPPALGVAQRSAVAEHTVEPVVDPLRDVEELRVALDHGPARIDPIVEQISQARPEELRDPAAPRTSS
jgi:hypothetical protein